MKKLLLILFCTATILNAQSAKITPIKIAAPKSNPKANVVVPKITTGIDSVDAKIANILKYALTFENPKYADRDLETELKDFIKVGLSKLKYNITLNKNGILSINFEKYVCSEKCYTSKFFFNFDLTNGKNLTINDVIGPDNMPKLYDTLLADKARQTKKFHSELQNKLKKKLTDSASYNKAFDISSRCNGAIFFANFSLTDKAISIKDECDFPETIRFLTPFYSTEFKYENIMNLLNESFIKKIH